MAHQGAVESLISVVLREIHPVTHTVCLIFVHAGDDGEYMVARISLCFISRCTVKDDTDCIQVIYLLEGYTFVVHLVPDGVRSLDSFLYLEGDPGIFQRGIYRCNELIDLLFLVDYVTVDLCADAMERLRLLVSEPDVLHLRFHSIQTKSVGKRNEYEHGLAEDLVSLVFRHELDGAAVVQTVGKFDQHNPDIVIQCEQDTLEVLCLHAFLLSLVLIVKNSLDFCQTFHQCGNLVAEQASEVINRIICIFYHIMKQSRYYGFVSQSDVVHDDFRHGYRVKDVWLTRASSDTLVCFVCKLEGFMDHFEFLRIAASFSRSFLKVCIISGYDFMVMLVEF